MDRYPHTWDSSKSGHPGQHWERHAAQSDTIEAWAIHHSPKDEVKHVPNQGSLK